MLMMEIAKWNETFENADTRKRQRLGWLFIPTGCDSNGYLSLVAQDGGFEAFGIFLAICQWSATQPRELRGKLVRTNGAPLTEKDISVRIRAEVCQVSAALKLLTSNDVGWIIGDDSEESASDLPAICQSSPDFVQGEGQGQGKGQGQGPPNPPRGNRAGWNPSEDQIKVASWFHRKPSTKWADDEIRKWKALPMESGDIQTLDAYYTADMPDGCDYRRRDLKTLLNNWRGEIDRARAFCGVTQSEQKPNRRKLPENWREIAEEIYGHPVNCPEDELTPSQYADIYRQSRS
jgi:hypothetical protein